MCSQQKNGKDSMTGRSVRTTSFATKSWWMNLMGTLLILSVLGTASAVTFSPSSTASPTRQPTHNPTQDLAFCSLVYSFDLNYTCTDNVPDNGINPCSVGFGCMGSAISSINSLNILNKKSTTLTRNIPTEIGYLTALTKIFIPSFKLTQGIPTEIGMV
jgi:hypothetical protein